MNNSFHEKMAGIFGIIAVILTFLLPIKFGMIAGTPEIAYAFPGTLLTLAFFNWPPAFFYLVSGLLLLGVVVCCPPPDHAELRTPSAIIAFTWVLLLMAALPGTVNASVSDFVFIQIIHFAGIASFAVAIMRLVQLKPGLKIWFLNAIVASTLLTALMGLSQYISGFAATLNYAYEQEMATGLKLSSGMQTRLQETRIFATFSICNSLAAHLILTIPLCIWAITKNLSTLKTVVAVSGAYICLMIIFSGINPFYFFICLFIVLTATVLVVNRGNKKNFKYIMPVVLIPSTGLLLFVLRYTNSRGGMIAFALSILFLIFLTPVNRKLKLFSGLLITIISAPVIFSDIFARSLASMEVRFDYFISALKMFMDHPACGTGWGDFFHEYTKIKTFPGDEAPHTPHNFILAFTSQTGFLGLVASILILTAPFWFYFRHKPIKNFNLKNALIITGWTAWGIHSLVDFNIQICGTAASAIVMLMLFEMPSSNDETREKQASGKIKFIWYFLLLVLSSTTAYYSFVRLMDEAEFAALSELCDPKIKKPASTKASFLQIEQQLKRTTRRMPDSPFPYICAGTHAFYLGEWHRAEMYYREAVKRSPERASLYYRLAISQRQLGKFKEAELNHKRAAELFPNAYNNK